jgi:tetratricopeptide (TPR) repeat protein
VLELLVEVLRAQGETAEELERARALAAVHREAGAHEKALAAMERVLELAPDDVTAHRDYADLCLRAQKKERAIEILELDVQRLKRENRLSDLAAVYRRILSIDATRKDVRRALAAMRRSKTDRMLRAAGLAAVVVALVSLAGFVGLRVHRRAHDRSVLDQAKERLDHGDVAGSRGLVESLLADQPTPETSQSAMRLLDRLDEAAAEATRAKRGQRDDQLSQRLEKLQAELDQKHYDTAISGCVALLREEKEPYLVDRVRGRLLRFKQTFVDAVGRTRAATKEWRSPERDEDVAPAYRRLADAFPFELTSALPNVRQVALDAASELTGPPRDWMREVVASADAYELAMTRLTPELESLKQRHLRLQTLQQLSSAYLEAARAAEAGNVERSRELLTKVLAEYGKGELSELFQKRLERLDQAAAAVHEIEQLVTQGDFELASSRTRQAGEEFKDLELLAHLRLPVLVDSVPHGARVLVDGTEVGTTPHLFRLPLNATTNVELALAHRVSQSLTLDRDGAARRTIELPRAARCGGRLAGTTLTPPVFAEGRWYVSGRDGTFHVLSIGPGAALVDRVVDSHSISGSLASPTPAPGGFLATIFDGRVVRVDATPEVPALLWTRPLADELRAAPVLFGSDVFVVTARGVVAVLALEDGTVRTTFELGKRVVGPAARVDDRLFVPLAGGSIGVVSLRGRSVERESPLGADLLGGLATDGTAIVAATATGKLLVLDPADGKPRGTVDLGDLPIDLPRVGDGYVDVALPKQVVRVDLARNAIVSTWSDVAPSGTPALVDGQIWIPCDKGLVEIVGPGSDEVLERVHLSSVGFAGAPLASELGVALLARDGSFVVLER